MRFLGPGLVLDDLDRARQEVPLRPDLTPTQLLSMVSALPKDPATGRTIEPCLRVILDGLRA